MHHHDTDFCYLINLFHLGKGKITLYLPKMRHILYLPLFFLLFSGCAESENPDSNLFRSIYKDTYWEIDGELISFSPGKLLLTDQFGCSSWEEGTFEKVDYDGCVYNTVTYVLVSETESSLTIKEIVSSGKTPKGGNCIGGEVIFNFQIVNKDLLKWTVNYDGKGSESGNLIKVNKSFSKKNCTSAPSKTGLFG